MSFTARPQSFASRIQSRIAKLNQGDGVRTRRPTGSEARQLLGIVGATVVFVVIAFSVGLLGLIAR